MKVIVKVQSLCKKGDGDADAADRFRSAVAAARVRAEVQRCRGAEVQRCRSAEVQRCRVGADVVQRWCRGSAEVVQRC